MYIRMENVVRQLTQCTHQQGFKRNYVQDAHTPPFQVIRAADRLESNTLQCKQSCSALSGKVDRSLVRPDCNHNYLPTHQYRSLLRPDCNHNYLPTHQYRSLLRPDCNHNYLSAHSPVLTGACPRFCLRSLRCL